jgi:hypothetical protein
LVEERGIEPRFSACKADVLPLNYTPVEVPDRFELSNKRFAVAPFNHSGKEPYFLTLSSTSITMTTNTKSTKAVSKPISIMLLKLADGVGFEPTQLSPRQFSRLVPYHSANHPINNNNYFSSSSSYSSTGFPSFLAHSTVFAVPPC